MASNGTVSSILSKALVVEVKVNEKTLENLEVLSVSQELLSLAFHEAKFMFLAKTKADNRGNQIRSFRLS